MKGLYVTVLRNADGSDCTLMGITSIVNTILLIDEKLDGLYEPKKDEFYLKLVRRKIFPNEPEYIHAEPYCNGEKIHKGAWTMFGGNYVTCSDSRIKALNRYPIPVHDRIESYQP